MSAKSEEAAHERKKAVAMVSPRWFVAELNTGMRENGFGERWCAKQIADNYQRQFPGADFRVRCEEAAEGEWIPDSAYIEHNLHRLRQFARCKVQT